MRSVTGRTGALIEVAAGFHPDLTGRENVFLQGAIMGMRRDEIATRFDEIVDFAGLERFIDTPVKRYSSGMNARLGFSIAAHLNPDVLLIDEVLAVGDMAFQEKCQARMQRLPLRRASPSCSSRIIFRRSRGCAARCLMLENGRTAQLGPPGDVIATYCRGTGTDATTTCRSAASLSTARRIGPIGAFEIEPGEHLTLDVTLDFHVDVEHATIGIVVWDQTRELYVYGASSDFVGIPPIRASSRRAAHVHVRVRRQPHARPLCHRGQRRRRRSPPLSCGRPRHPPLSRRRASLL